MNKFNVFLLFYIAVFILYATAPEPIIISQTPL